MQTLLLFYCTISGSVFVSIFPRSLQGNQYVGLDVCPTRHSARPSEEERGISVVALNENGLDASKSLFKNNLSGSLESAEVMDKQQRCCHLFKIWFLVVSMRAVQLAVEVEAPRSERSRGRKSGR
jgi:hypothetical protein